MQEYNIPAIDLVIVDLYPFEETLRTTAEEKLIIEKIDIGGPSMLRAAAKNFKDLVVIASKDDYQPFTRLLQEQQAHTTLEQRKAFAAKAFEVVMHYDVAISQYFNSTKQTLRYGENPHQQATFYGDLSQVFTQLNGKELSYNNLVDVEAAIQLISDFKNPGYYVDGSSWDTVFGIIKHTNVCGIASRGTVHEAWEAALAGDPESAFGGVLVCNGTIDEATAQAINEIFFEVLVADDFDSAALDILKTKKNRILLQLHPGYVQPAVQSKTLLNGTLEQDTDKGNVAEWKEAGGRIANATEQKELAFANLVCKHLKSNAIALTHNLQLIGKGCGQTSRIDSLRHAIEKAKQFDFPLQGAYLASDAFFPFDDCVKMAHAEGITAFIQPGGSIRDKDSIAYCMENNLVMVITGMRHFRH
jgi:phosphoribosylaminoimidazolecarboxamide formyltransferase/IMP cyclohydrolase